MSRLGQLLENWRSFSASRRYVTQERTPFFLLAKQFISGDSRVLDVGAGDGAFAESIGKDDVYMLEGSRESYDRLTTRYSNCVFGQLPDLPFEDRFFHMIHASHVVEHLSPNDLYRFLTEADRCLKTGGVLVLSAPLLWKGFYGDLSHIKPYDPQVFLNYLCSNPEHDCPTRPGISGDYLCESLVFRFREVTLAELFTESGNVHSLLLDNICRLYMVLKHKLGFRTFEKTGFTLIARKRKPAGGSTVTREFRGE